MQTVPAMIFHIDAIIVRTGNREEVVISEICGYNCVVENVKILLWIDFNLCVTLSSLKLEHQSSMCKPIFLEKCWPFPEYSTNNSIIIQICDIFMGFCELKVLNH